MSNYNKKNQIALPKNFEEDNLHEAKKILRGGNSKDDTFEILADMIGYYIEENVEELPNKEILEDFINQSTQTILDKAIKECLEEEKRWPEITEYDKLNQAFKELSANGIVAQENFTCCQTCGSAEIHDYAKENDYGYTFFHQQDTDRAVEGSGVYLSYGHVGLAKKSMEEITGQIINTIEKNGLKAVWDGSVRTRILVELDWKKRLSPEYLN